MSSIRREVAYAATRGSHAKHLSSCLPDEILGMIGCRAAPHDGLKAEALRPTCRELGSGITPLVWTSIAVPSDQDALNELCDEPGSNHAV